MPASSNPKGSGKRKKYKPLKAAPISVRAHADYAGREATYSGRSMGVFAASTLLTAGAGAPVGAAYMGYRGSKARIATYNKAGYGTRGQIRKQNRSAKGKGRSGGGRRQRRDRHGKFA